MEKDFTNKQDLIGVELTAYFMLDENDVFYLLKNPKVFIRDRYYILKPCTLEIPNKGDRVKMRLTFISA